MMDVSTAYLNISHQCLLHKICKKRIDIKMVDCIFLLLTNCQTIVKTNKYTMPKLFVDRSSIRLPLSSILYFFYNRDLFDNYTKKKVDT